MRDVDARRSRKAPRLMLVLGVAVLVAGCSRGITSGGSGPRPDSARRKQTLEQFPLDSLDMVGTLGRGAGLVALVMAPDRVTYRVRPGAYMGQSDGRVTGIFEDRIELMELVPDGAGGWLERPATVALEDQ